MSPDRRQAFLLLKGWIVHDRTAEIADISKLSASKVETERPSPLGDRGRDVRAVVGPEDLQLGIRIETSHPLFTHVGIEFLEQYALAGTRGQRVMHSPQASGA